MNTQEISKIEGAIEAILFTMGDSVELEKIAAAICHDESTTRRMIHHMMDKYRKDLAKSGNVVKKERLDILNDLINSYKFEKDTDIFKIRKKDLEVVNKKIKKILKDDLKEYVEKDIIKNIKKLFNEVEDETKMKKIVDDITKFVNGTYQRQLLENIDIKILVKDTTLINGVKEQSERYLFTLENSRLFNEK